MPAMKMGPKSSTAEDPLDLSMLPEKKDYRRIDKFAREYLRVPKGAGAGEPFKMRGWQKNEIVKRMFPPTGKRPRQGLVSMPRGNGKSGLAAVLGMYALLADGVEGAQVLIVASDERQARIVFNTARRMVELDERLSEQVQIFRDRLYVPATDSMLMPLPAEPAALQGFDPTLTIVDELHVVTEPVWDAMALAAGKRAESLTLAISTPADNVDSVMWRLVEYGRNNPDDKSFALVEYATPESYAIDDVEGWKIGNPALGDFLFEDAVSATLKTTREEPFRRYRLGQWVGSANSWIPWGVFEQRADAERGQPEAGTKVCLGFDGSASGDSTALVGCTLDGHIFVVAAWEAPKDDQRWRVPRNEVTAMVASAFEQWDVVELAADPWGWRSELEEWEAAHKNVVQWNTAHAQRMAPATDRLYAAIMDETMTFDGDPRLVEHINNCVPKSTALGDLVHKDKRNSTRKIDLAVAAIVAYDRAAWHLANPPKRRRVIAH